VTTYRGFKFLDMSTPEKRIETAVGEVLDEVPIEECFEDTIVMRYWLDPSIAAPLCGDDMPGVPSSGDFIRPAIGVQHPLAKLAEAHKGWFRIKHVCHDLTEGRIVYLVEPGSP